ncbi:sugar MFS transporter [Rhizosphaericola mali]|uniref:Sugar MFS transporter n=1 Tax=Rhizosphaericola mali TaxID=2545455 RepID=A0A5P2G290_9BACT|nr:sugar MFS transporter [Rhizosphaericola mali]QES88209.1 sugar MFS transporter [Rhizosphaericola mali]
MASFNPTSSIASTSSVSTNQKTNIVPLITLTLLFFMWGFITCMNDILIPYLKKLFTLSYTQSMLVQLAFFGAYFIGSLVYFLISKFKGDPINKVGYKKGIIFGIMLSAIGCLLFIPASATKLYGVFLIALFVLGLGFTVLQITANAYVTLLGAPETASSRLNMTQAFNSLGTTLAPVIGGHVIFSIYKNADGTLSDQATKIPYIVFAAILVIVALVISKVKLPEFNQNNDVTETSEPNDSMGALKFWNLKLGVLGIFFYVGAEVGIGSLMISYIEHTLNMNEDAAKGFLALYWGGAMAGRFMATFAFNGTINLVKRLIYMILICGGIFVLLFYISKLQFEQMSFFALMMGVNIIGFLIGKSSASFSLSLFAIVNIALVAIGLMVPGALSVHLLLGIGLFNSIMFSNIYTLGVSGLGKYTSQGSSLLVMAILGGAILPLLQGWIADTYNLKVSYIIPVLCYVYIAFFGMVCNKRKIG